MAAPKENLLSIGHLAGTERNTFTKQREHRLKKRPMLLQTDSSALQNHQHSRAMHLQQRWQELKERELIAQQHNRQLLQQFKKAEDTVREMLSLTADMRTIRMAYERYLEESTPRWQQQLKMKTQAAQRKCMEENWRSCLKNTEDQETKCSADRPLFSQGSTTKSQKIAAPQKHYSQNSHLDDSQDGSPHLPYMPSPWQTHPHSQMARFPIRAPYQPQGSSHVPPPIFPHPFRLHHLASMPAPHHPWPRQNPPGWASPQPDHPWSWTAGAAGIPSGSEALWGQLYMEEPPSGREVAQDVGEEAETSRALNSKRERGGGSRSSLLSQELDIKPVRLSSGPAESSESSKESSQVGGEKRKKREKRGRSRRTSSDRERCSSRVSSRASSAIITAAVTVAQSSESDASLEKGRASTSMRRRRSAGLSVGSPRAEQVMKEKIRSNGDDSGSRKEESQSTAEESRSEEAGDQSPDDKSESCREESGSQWEAESGSVSIKIENRGGGEIEKQESSSSEEEEHEKDLRDRDEEEDDGEEKEHCQRDEEQEESDVEDDDEFSEGKDTREEEEDTEEEMEEQDSEEKAEKDEQSDRLKNDDGENEKKGSAASQDEEVDEDDSEGSVDKMEEDVESDEEEEGGGVEEEEWRRNEAGEPEEERDSEDSIITPQNKSKKMHIIPEEASEDDEEEKEEEGSKTESSDDDSNEDIEHLLAPQEQSQKKEEKDLRADEKPKATCDKVEIFQVELDRSAKTDRLSESDEFDDFYD